jgi:hypothetical protein
MGLRSAVFWFAIGFLLTSSVHGQTQTERVLRGRLISIERGEFSPIPLKGVVVSLRESGTSAITDDQGMFKLPLTSRLHARQVLSIDQHNPSYGILYPFLGRFYLPQTLNDPVEVRLLPRGSKRWFSDERIEDFLNFDPDASTWVRELAKQSGFPVEEVQARISKYLAATRMVGFEEFRIQIEAAIGPGLDGKQGPPVWRVQLLSCPIDSFVGTQSTIKPRITLDQLHHLSRRQRQEPDLAKLRAIGDAVRMSILDENLEPALKASIYLARSQRKGLRLVVVLKEEKATAGIISPAELPVEAIRFPQILTLSDFPATGRDFTVSRSLLERSPVASSEVIYPVRMLVVASAPTDQDDPKVEESVAAIREALKGLAFDAAGQPLANGPVRVTVCDPPTWNRFRQLLRDEGPWHIVHFVGHGGFQVVGEDPMPRAHLLFERPGSRETDPIGAFDFGAALNLPDLKLVVLMPCSSAVARSRDPGKSKYAANALDGVAHHLLRTTYASAVVAMQFDLEVAAANVFTGEFYKSLLSDQQNIDLAVGRCRQTLAARFNLGSGVWITPALYSLSRNGRVFEFRERLGLGGSVIDADTLRPLPGVKLTIEDVNDLFGKTPTAVTDEAGRFRFQDLPPLSERRQVRLVAQKSGYLVSRAVTTLGNMSHVVKLTAYIGGDRD